MLLTYLEEREDAGDTVGGITRWWFERQAFAEAHRRVELALQLLVGQGKLLKRSLLGGEDLFYLPALDAKARVDSLDPEGSA